MFHSETLARVIHADRVRDLERAAEAHRLLTTDDLEVETPRQAASPATRPTVAAACASDDPAPRIDGSPGLAA